MIKIMEYQEYGLKLTQVYEGSTEGLYNIMVMDLLGKSLEDLFVDLNKKFTLSTTLQIA